MAAHHQNDNATMLSIEALYQQSEVERTLKVSQPETLRHSLRRRERFKLPLINSKPLDSFLSATNTEAEGLEGLVLSGLKYPAIEQDSALPKSLNLAHIKTAISNHAEPQITPEIIKHKQPETENSEELAQQDPMTAIRQAVMTAADTQSQPVTSPAMPAEKSQLHQDLQSLITKLVTLIEDEVEDRLAKQHTMPTSETAPLKPKKSKAALSSGKKTASKSRKKKDSK